MSPNTSKGAFSVYVEFRILPFSKPAVFISIGMIVYPDLGMQVYEHKVFASKNIWILHSLKGITLNMHFKILV